MTGMSQPQPSGRRKRRPERRDEILDAAVDLFYERGYQATSLDEVGSAVGIAGPSIYRHFGSKLEILDAALHRGGEHVMRKVAEVAAAGGSPEVVLEQLARDLVVAVMQRPKLSVVVTRERHHIPLESRDWWERSYRLMTEEWVHVLRRVRPDLDDEQARFAVRLVLSMIYSTPDHLPDAPPPGTEDRLVAMALAALGGA